MSQKFAGIFLVAAAATLLAFGARATSGYSVVYAFCHGMDCPDGDTPGGLIADASGNLYGTTEYGGGKLRNCELGSFGCGVIFALSPGGAETVLYAFGTAKDDGIQPNSPLLRDSAGNLYGTTLEGGSNGAGVAFRLAPDGTLTVLHAFCVSCTTGSNPEAGLVMDGEGNLYGTARNGGDNACGVAFKIDPAGNETVLHSFGASQDDGCTPQAALLVDAGGALFGTTTAGGRKRDGTIFKLGASGAYKVLYTFCAQSGCPDGKVPASALTPDGAGNFYGTAWQGGAHGKGVVYKLSRAGTETVLYDFCAQSHCADGASPIAGVRVSSNGQVIFGNTIAGGAHNDGVVFKLSGGTESVLHSFAGQPGDGSEAFEPLVNVNGWFYGTTSDGGSQGHGTVFKVGTSGDGRR